MQALSGLPLRCLSIRLWRICDVRLVVSPASSKAVQQTCHMLCDLFKHMP